MGYRDAWDQDMLEVAKGMLAPDGSKIKIRIGIHTGPAYFGIVGVKCPKYTLIGDTVNTGSSFPSHAAAVLRPHVMPWSRLGHAAPVVDPGRDRCASLTKPMFLRKAVLAFVVFITSPPLLLTPQRTRLRPHL